MQPTAELSFPRTRSSISSGVLGMIFLLTTECMLFAGFISAYIVNRASIPAWQPADQPRLPVEMTAVNTIILILSGILVLRAQRKTDSSLASMRRYLQLGLVFGSTFLAVQGYEWMRLLAFGLNSNTSLYGAFFYLIIGAHALHVVAGLIVLGWLLRVLKSQRSETDKVSVVGVGSLYWYFVVAVWPILYFLVYLS